MKTRNIKPKFSISTESGKKTRKTRGGESRKNPGYEKNQPKRRRRRNKIEIYIFKLQKMKTRNIKP